jgi:hypothetical protein
MYRKKVTKLNEMCVTFVVEVTSRKVKVSYISHSCDHKNSLSAATLNRLSSYLSYLHKLLSHTQ